jgi:hypothetical protein
MKIIKREILKNNKKKCPICSSSLTIPIAYGHMSENR